MSADRLLRVRVGDLALPVDELDRAIVLPAGPVLREHARPVLGVRPELDAAFALYSRDPARHDRFHRSDTRGVDLEVPLVEHDAQLEHSCLRGLADASVAEIETEEIGVGRWLSPRTVDRATHRARRRGDFAGECGRRVIEPLTNGCAIDPRPPRDLGLRETLRARRTHQPVLLDLVHAAVYRTHVRRAPGEIRTHTVRVLNPLSLPVGIRGRSGSA